MGVYKGGYGRGGVYPMGVQRYGGDSVG